jgi:hypothetical protein
MSSMVMVDIHLRALAIGITFHLTIDKSKWHNLAALGGICFYLFIIFYYLLGDLKIG